jgi:glucose/arabinose dehydrogenase
MKKAIIFLSLVLGLKVNAQTLNFQPFASGFSAPINLVSLPQDTLIYVVQQRGLVRMVRPDGTILSTPFINLSDRVSASGSERGLLGLAFAPDYAQSGRFYVNYTDISTGHTKISRFLRSSTNPLQGDPTSEEVLLTINQPFSNHNGGHLAFGPDGYLYIGTGDGGSANDPQNQGQNTASLLGKFLRIDVQGAQGYVVPADNPFVGQSTFAPEIWALGLRNPWRFSFDPQTGDLWSGDVGQNSWEEINRAVTGTAGLNYGWRCYEGNSTFNTNGCGPQTNFFFPTYVYANNQSNGCSVTGGVVYRGGLYGPLFGKYLFTDYCSGIFRQTYPDGAGGFQTDVLNAASGFFPAIGTDGFGELYLLNSQAGTMLKIIPDACNPVASIYSAQPVLAICGSQDSILLQTPFHPTLSYSWKKQGQVVGQQDQIWVSQPGWIALEVTAPNGCGTALDSVMINQFPTPTLTWNIPSGTVCADSLIALDASPAGGLFLGQGVSSNVWNTQGLSGSVTLTYAFTTSDGCVVEQPETFQVISCATGLVEDPNSAKFKVFPTPADRFLHLKMPAETERVICVSAASGKQVGSWSTDGLTDMDLRIDHLAPGAYLMIFQHPQGVQVRKWMR